VVVIGVQTLAYLIADVATSSSGQDHDRAVAAAPPQQVCTRVEMRTKPSGCDICVRAHGVQATRKRISCVGGPAGSVETKNRRHIWCSGELALYCDG
jgi:hypothetical protein